MKTRKGFKCESCNTKEDMTHDEAMEHLGHDYKEPAHTTTPWDYRIDSDGAVIIYQINDPANYVFVNSGADGNVPFKGVKEDAAFIVQAVNTHEMLVQALREISSSGSLSIVKAKAFQALAQAEGK